MRNLHRIWSHASLSRARNPGDLRRLCCKLMYGLHVAWLNSAKLRRLDGLQARALRKITGIKHSFMSRVSNAEILQQAQRRPLSRVPLERQLLHFGRIIARLPDEDVLRQCLL